MSTRAIGLAAGLGLVAATLILPAHAARRVLYVDSYHAGYARSDRILKGIKSVLNGADASLHIYHMDTRRNPDEADKRKSALQARELIASYQPDVVIASDDNACKYLIMPYYKDASLPFVFCGIGYSLNDYGFPYSNVTGILELPPTVNLIYSLKYIKPVATVGYLAADTPNGRKEGYYSKSNMREDFVGWYVRSFEEWMMAFNQLQNRVDVLIVGNSRGIEGWNDVEAQRFALKYTRIPTGCLVGWMAPKVLLGATHGARQQGIYAAQMALKILNGTPPSHIPILSDIPADIIVNRKIARKLGVKIPDSFVKIAAQVIE